MCGRFTQTNDLAALQQHFKLIDVRADAVPRYNIAPTQPLPIVLREERGNALEELRWGLVPAFAKALKGSPHPINAKAETLHTSGMFRRLIKSRRCLVPADGFYEWREEGGKKLPLRFQRADGALFAFAGLWDCWRDPADASAPELRTFTIVTTAANDLIRPIHDRMPVILAPEDEERWLDPSLDAESVRGLLRPFPPSAMRAYACLPLVNDVRNRGPECIAAC